MRTSETAGKIEKILREAFEPSHFVLEDESHHHAGHKAAGGGGHYFLEIRSKRFNGVAPLARQRLVLEAVKAMMDSNEIHALSMKCTPEE